MLKPFARAHVAVALVIACLGIADRAGAQPQLPGVVRAEVQKRLRQALRESNPGVIAAVSILRGVGFAYASADAPDSAIVRDWDVSFFSGAEADATNSGVHDGQPTAAHGEARAETMGWIPFSGPSLRETSTSASGPGAEGLAFAKAGLGVRYDSTEDNERVFVDLDLDDITLHFDSIPQSGAGQQPYRGVFRLSDLPVEQVSLDLSGSIPDAILESAGLSRGNAETVFFELDLALGANGLFEFSTSGAAELLTPFTPEDFEVTGSSPGSLSVRYVGDTKTIAFDLPLNTDLEFGAEIFSEVNTVPAPTAWVLLPFAALACRRRRSGYVVRS